MRPYPEELLRALQGGVVSHFAPELQSDYAKAQFAFSILLFTIAQKDADSSVQDVVDANVALRELLGATHDALAGVDRDDARDARTALATLPAPAASLRLSALRGENDALRAALAALTPLIEPAADDPSLAALAPVRQRIYDHLSADARRRTVPILSN
jgi:hypothetical protein